MESLAPVPQPIVESDPDVVVREGSTELPRLRSEAPVGPGVVKPSLGGDIVSNTSAGEVRTTLPGTASVARQELPESGPVADSGRTILNLSAKKGPELGSKAPLTGLEGTGTSAATEPDVMLTQSAIEAEMTPEVDCPVVASDRLRSATYPTIDRQSVESLPEEALAEGDFLDSGFDGFSEAFEEASTEELAKPSRVQLAARETILNHVLQLRDLGRSHLDVKFQPDAETTINLHLQSIDGEIVITAQLEQGSLELAKEWNALQRSLTRDGIQLRDLETGSGRDGQRAHGDSKPDENADSGSQQSRMRGGADALFLVDAALDVEPFPGVVAANEYGSTWQAWS